MLTVWLTTRKGKGRKKRYYLNWQEPRLCPDAEPLRYPNGRVKMRVHQESCKTCDKVTAEAMRLDKQQKLNGLVKVADDSGLTLAILADKVEEWQRQDGVGERTIYLTELAMRMFRSFMGARHADIVHAADVTREHVREYIGHRRAEGRKPKTIRREIGSVGRAYSTAVELEYLTVNPFQIEARKMRVPKMKWEPLEADDVERPLAACAEDDELYLYVRIILGSGARAEETGYLRFEDVRDGCIRSRRRKGDKEHTLFISEPTEALLAAWREKRANSEWVFRSDDDTERFHYSRMRTRFVSSVGRAKIVGKKVTLPLLRKTVGCDLLERGVDLKVVSEFLGHSTPAVTSDYYLKVRDRQLRAAASVLHSGAPVVVPLRPTGSEAQSCQA